MSTLGHIVEQACNEAPWRMRTRFDPAIDFHNEVWTALLAADLPESVSIELQAVVNRLARNQGEKRCRQHRLLDRHRLPARAVDRPEEVAIASECISAAVQSDLDRELIAIQLGAHPRHRSISEFAQCQQGCSRTKTYEAWGGLQARLLRLATS
jgi:hypothetical protein